MTQARFAERLDETTDLIECVLDAIQQGGEQVDLADLLGLLGYQLLACMRLVERDPGLEMAAADLFAATTALVNDRHDGAPPTVRTQRLLRDAHSRFKHRLSSSHPSEHATRTIWQHHELVKAA
jgi:hypothetical protein